VLEESRRHYVKRLDEADSREQKRLKQIEIEWRDFRRAQEKALSEALELIKRAGERQEARAAAKEVRDQRDEEYQALTLQRRRRPEPLADDGGPLDEGQAVDVPGLARAGKVLRAWHPQEGQDVSLEIDGKRLSLPRSEVVRKGAAAAVSKGKGRRAGATRLNIPSAGGPSQLELKVIGLKVDEALVEVDRFIDKAVLQGMPWVRIIHGHGTGALRKAISAHLKELPYVSNWGPADPQSGGDAVTVVELAG
jgi:DNA mismatch repair protein MutS2